MPLHQFKTKGTTEKALTNTDRSQKSKAIHQFVDNRPEAIQQASMQTMANSHQTALQSKIAPGLIDSIGAQLPVQKKENKTGLPDALKSGIEHLSGLSMDDVKVQYNSKQPAQLNAHAFAQGHQIHIAPGQQKHLPHEAWHVVQQMQGRVKPTLQMKGKTLINDDVALEKEADRMGARANAFRTNSHQVQLRAMANALGATVQRVVPNPPHTHFKENPVTNYAARGGGNVAFNMNTYPRSNFSFGAHTRNAVFLRYNPQYAGNRIISIRGSSGEQVNVEGVQLDHQVSWHNISTAMHNHNTGLQQRWTNHIGYSLYDAKMYYNDTTNLIPALGGLNAAAGALGVNEQPRIHHGLETYQGHLQTAWMNLQAGLVAVGHGISEDNAVHIADLLHQITTRMNDTTERLL